MTAKGARAAALTILEHYRKLGKWPESAARHITATRCPDKRDAALAFALSMGVIQHKILLDFYISSFSNVANSKIQPQVRDILRLGLYQIAFMDRVPNSAAVHESVSLTKKTTPQASGFVNAVLRKASALTDFPQPSQDDTGVYLSISNSFPRWIADRFLPILGLSGTEALLWQLNKIPPVYAQVNTDKTDADSLIRELNDTDLRCYRHEWLENCLIIENPRDMTDTPAFVGGKFYIQDPSSRLAVLSADIQPGQRVIDGCAAPGGKSFAAALAVGKTGSVLSLDIKEAGVEKLKAGARRLGLDSVISAEIHDSRRPLDVLPADVVLADVPCSGLGVIAKKPDIKYKPESELASLPPLQGELLRSLSAHVKPGGLLIYSTCTLLPEENEDVVSEFLLADTDFEPEPFTLPGPSGGNFSAKQYVWPHIYGTDGFFIARLRRKQERNNA